MSGLLDKANKAAEDKEEAVNAFAENQAPASFFETNDTDSEIDKRILIGLQIGGIVALIVSMFLLIQTGWLYATILDYIIAAGVLIFGWSLFNGSDYLGDGLSNTKMAITAVGFASLFFATIVGTIFMNAGGGVTIASAELDGDNDEIDLSFFGPRGMEYTVEILVDGSVAYTHDSEINVDRGSHSIPLDEFWAGNSMDMNGRSIVNYEVKVTSEGGSDSKSIDDMMVREVDTGYAKVTEYFTTDSGSGEKTYTGISVEMILGIGDPSADYSFSSDYFTGTPPKTITSDWSATLAVKKGSTTVYQYSTIQANEGLVNGLGEFWVGWVIMPGTEAGNLARDDFYDGDGCYTFEITIDNEHGNTFVSTDSQIRFYWDENEADNDSDKTAEGC